MLAASTSVAELRENRLAMLANASREWNWKQRPRSWTAGRHDQPLISAAIRETADLGSRLVSLHVLRNSFSRTVRLAHGKRWHPLLQ